MTLCREFWRSPSLTFLTFNSPEYKRIASFQGDFYFQVPRRYALRYLSRTQDAWSYREFEFIHRWMPSSKILRYSLEEGQIYSRNRFLSRE